MLGGSGVRSIDFSNMCEEFKSLIGKKLKGYGKILIKTREETNGLAIEKAKLIR